MSNGDTSITAAERGQNYNWESDARHYEEECDKLRDLLARVEASGERDAYLKDVFRAHLLDIKNECLMSKEGNWHPDANIILSYIQEALNKEKI